jgi:hypothetical protein
MLKILIFKKARQQYLFKKFGGYPYKGGLNFLKSFAVKQPFKY